MVRLVDLPNVSLQFVCAHLAVTDVLNLRLTCSKMFQASKCKEFYGKVQICMAKIKETDLKLFQKLCEELAIIIMFNIEGCFEERLEWILPFAKNVRNVLVNIKYLEQACRELKYIKYLVINYIYSDGLKDSDINFSCLSSAAKIDQLCIKGTVNNFEKLYLYQFMVNDILKYTEQISKICLEDIDLRKGNGIAKSEDPLSNEDIDLQKGNGVAESEDPLSNEDSLSKQIRKSNHIRQWKFKNVITDDDIFDLPSDITVLECRYTNCISFKVYKFDNLEKLVLESIKFENDIFEFKNLKVLEITGHLRDDGLVGKRIDCPKLEIIRLFKIHHIGSFQQLFTCESKRLHLTIIHDLSNTEISWILQNKPLLNRSFTYNNMEKAYRMSEKEKKITKMAAEKKRKPTEKSNSNYLGKSKIRSIASIITLLFLGTFKAANIANIRYNYCGF